MTKMRTYFTIRLCEGATTVTIDIFSSIFLYLLGRAPTPRGLFVSCEQESSFPFPLLDLHLAFLAPVPFAKQRLIAWRPLMGSHCTTWPYSDTDI